MKIEFSESKIVWCDGDGYKKVKGHRTEDIACVPPMWASYPTVWNFDWRQKEVGNDS